MRILAVGNLIHDTVITVESFLSDGKVFANDLKEYSGGQGANVASTVAGFGLAVDFCFRSGDDEIGRSGRQSLVEVGVGIEGGLTVPEAQSMRAVVLVERSTGKRSVLMHRDPSLFSKELLISDQVIEKADLLYSDGYEYDAVYSAAAKMRSCGKPLILDVEEVDERQRRLLPFVTHLIAPEWAICQLANRTDTENALNDLKQLGLTAVIATRGENGSLAMIEGSAKPIAIAATKAKIVDTTGAGDAFHAAYIAALAIGMPEGARLSFSSRVAAAKCQCPGPRLAPNILKFFRAELYPHD